VSAINLNILSFSIFSSSNIKNLLVLDIDEVSSVVGEDLPPSRVGAPDLHVGGLSCALNIPRLVV
jgi:hypothetical protein